MDLLKQTCNLLELDILLTKERVYLGITNTDLEHLIKGKADNRSLQTINRSHIRHTPRHVTPCSLLNMAARANTRVKNTHGYGSDHHRVIRLLLLLWNEEWNLRNEEMDRR